MSDNIKHSVAIEDLSHSLKIIKDYVNGKTKH